MLWERANTYALASRYTFQEPTFPGAEQLRLGGKITTHYKRKSIRMISVGMGKEYGGGEMEGRHAAIKQQF